MNAASSLSEPAASGVLPRETSQATPFLKMNGLGNDFVLFDARQGRLAPDCMSPGLARAIGDRHRGVGFDQLILLSDVASGPGAAHAAFWNVDGSLSAACGNGVRCAADLVLRETGETRVTIATDGGPIVCERLEDGRIQADMGPPRLDWRDIPLRDAHDTRRIDVKLGPIDAPVLWGPGAVNMGNPHAVFFVEDLRAVDLEKLGPMIEHHPMFPERTNVEFVQVLAPDRLRMRVWERGVGVTLACGSGACAAVVAGARRELCARQATVDLDGGALEIDWGADDHVRMAGPTALAFAGALTAGFVAAARAAERAAAAAESASSSAQFEHALAESEAAADAAASALSGAEPHGGAL